VANAGGIINIASAICRPYDAIVAASEVKKIGRVVEEILT
jgi:hypothetical protein